MAKKINKNKKAIDKKKKLLPKKNKRVSGVERKPNRYNAIQKILSAYGREADIKFGKDFQKICSQFNALTKQYPLKFVEQNVEQLYIDLMKKSPEKSDFPKEFPFYKLEETLNTPQFDGITITYDFDDGLTQFTATGDAFAVLDEYKAGCYRYLRNNYDGSDNMAVFRLVETDNKTFVKYIIDVGERKVTETPPETDKNAPPLPPTDKGGVKYSPEQAIALEREKQKTEKLKQKTMDKILKLMEKGYTKAEINKLLGL